eukprot:6634391-Alexandrium_andersonii.AAC.1
MHAAIERARIEGGGGVAPQQYLRTVAVKAWPDLPRKLAWQHWALPTVQRALSTAQDSFRRSPVGWARILGAQ